MRGFVLFTFGLVLFACMDTAIKWLSQDYAVPLVVAVRYVIHALLMLVLLAPRLGMKLVQTQRTGLVILRGAALATGSLFAALAFKRMPVAETTAILFLAPVVVVLSAGRLLGEKVARTDWIALTLGFLGVLLIARPGAGLDPVGVACALCAMACTSSYQLLSRVLVRTERVVTMLFHTALAGAVMLGAVAPWFLDGPRPTALQAGLFVFIGAAGGVGHYFFTAAHQDTPASKLAPMVYIQLVFASILGWWVFGHVPDRVAIGGMGVIAAAGLLVAMARRSPPEPAEP